VVSPPRSVTPDRTGRTPGGRPWLHYVAPMAGFLVLTAAEDLLPRPGGEVAPGAYAAFYAFKVAAVSVLAWLCRPAWRDLRPLPGLFWTSVAVATGLFVTLLWVALDGRVPSLPLTEGRTAFDPRGLSSPVQPLFLAARLYGLILLVPLIEELFWRSFVIRWIIRPDFRSVPIGRVTPLAAGASAALFALAHPEWLPALAAGLLWAGLLAKSRSVAVCWISHLTANLALGVYILATASWWFW